MRPGHASVDPLPGWARAADFVALALAIIALTVAVSGGFRLHLGAWRLALTSPLRPLSVAVAIVAVRHALARHESMSTHLWTWVAGWGRSVPFVTASTVALATRPVMFLAGYLAVFMFGYAPGARPFHDFASELQNLPLRWDTGWYLQIARDGYQFTAAAGASSQQNIVFFPGFPLLVRGAALLLGNGQGAYVLGGTVTSFAAFVLALAYLYCLAREFLTAEQSTTALWLLAVYPFAIFYGAIYSESLFLLGTVGAFHHYRRGELVRAGGWGLLVGLTRPNGFLLSLPLAICALERGPSTARRLSFASATAAAMPVVGALMYSGFIWRLSGHPFAWAAGHAAWGRHYQGLAHLVTDHYRAVAGEGLSAYLSQQPYDFLNGLGVLFVLAAAWPVARRFSIAYAVFILINILPPLSTGGLLSAGRLSSVLFPAFLWLAAAVAPQYRAGWIAAFAAFQAFNAALFYTWRPLF